MRRTHWLDDDETPVLSQSPLKRAKELRAALNKCRAVGLAPQRNPGQVLLWMETLRYEIPVRYRGHYRGGVPIYRFKHDMQAKYQVGRPYCGEDRCALYGNPVEVAYTAQNSYPVNMLAVWADVERLGLPREIDDWQTLFYAPQGVPVAAYEIEHLYDKPGRPYAFRLLEGEDALQELRIPRPASYNGERFCSARTDDGGLNMAWFGLLRLSHFKALRPVGTREHIEKWQKQGLMPEIEPGRILVWKCVEIPKPSGSGEQPAGYRGILGASYAMHRDYYYPESMVCAGPIGAARGFIKPGSPGYVMAILTPADLLFSVHDRDGVFYAVNGTPIACYHAEAVTADEFDLRLIEGLDALAWVD